MTPDTRLTLLLSGIASFILMGAGQAVFGPALPIFQRSFGLDTATVGWLISAFWIGSFLGVVAMYFIGSRVPPTVGLAAILVGAVLLATPPGWAAALIGAGLFGSGYGCIAALFNPRILNAFGPRGPAMLSLLNATFAIGAIATPLIFVSLGSDPKLIFWTIAALTALTLIASARIGTTGVTPAVDTTPFRLHSPILCFGMVAIGIEVSLVGLGPTAMIRAGLPADRAAELLSLFFVAYLAGRLGLVPLANRTPPFAIYSAACAIAALCALGCALFNPAWFFPPLGLAAGLFFPGYYVTATAKMGVDARVGPLILGVGLIGAILSPLVYIRLMEIGGARGFFWLIAGVAGALTLLALVSRRRMAR